MKRALLALWLTGAIVYTPTVADFQSLEAASTKSEQAEVHSVVVDMPASHLAAASVSRSLGFVLGYLPPPVQLVSSLLQLAKRRKPALTRLRLSF